MSLFRRGTPDVRALARNGDVQGLVEAAEHRQAMDDGDGTAVDLGVPVRRAALLALGELDDERAHEALQQALGDPDPLVRAVAVGGLARRHDAISLARIVGWWPETADGPARQLAIRALFELAAPGSSQELATALLERAGDEPISATDAALVSDLLDVEGTDDAAEQVIDTVVSALGARRAAVANRAEALAVQLAPAGVDRLIAELRAGDAPRQAALALGAIKDGRALGPLIEALDSHDCMVRAESCQALAELKDPLAVEPLMRATRDPEHIVRVCASSAVNAFGAVGVVTGVAAILRPLLAGVGSDSGLSPMDARHSVLGTGDRSAGHGRRNGNGHAGEREEWFGGAIELTERVESGQADSP